MANKTLTEDLSILRQMFRLAVNDRLIDRSPMDNIAPLTILTPECNPYTIDELDRLTAADCRCESVKNAVLLACHIGTRISETLAFCEEDYDPLKKRIKVDRAVVLGQYKRPKTEKSRRWVKLTDTAVGIIERQIALTQHLKPRQLKVLENDKKTVTRFKGRLLFVNLNTKRPYLNSKACYPAFKELLHNADVSSRGINQARHTFASQAITAGANLSWVAKQLGHGSLAMVNRHYARWIEEDSTDNTVLLDKHLTKKQTVNEDNEKKNKASTHAQRDCLSPEDDFAGSDILYV